MLLHSTLIYFKRNDINRLLVKNFLFLPHLLKFNRTLLCFFYVVSTNSILLTSFSLKTRFNELILLRIRFETSSTTMIFCLHLLAHHQQIQHEARESIKRILEKHDGNWCYDAVMEMSFLEQIIEGGENLKERRKNQSKTLHSSSFLLRQKH